jgi:primary-amine oxidase
VLLANARVGRLPLAVASLLGAVSLLTGCALGGTPLQDAQPIDAAEISFEDQDSCASQAAKSLQVQFKVEAAWSFCWAINPPVGLSIIAAAYSPASGTEIPVFRSASLAQIHVPYDDGERGQLDLPAFGSLTASMEQEDCPGGLIGVDGDESIDRGASLCARIVDDGLRYASSHHMDENRSGAGECLEAYTMTPVDWYTYLNRWTFCDDGTVLPSVGASGKLAPSYFGDQSNSTPLGPNGTELHLSHFHNVFWRIHFDLGASGSLAVEHVTYSNDGPEFTTSVNQVTHETSAQSSPGEVWRVASTALRNSDGNSASYDIDLHNDSPYRGVPGHSYTDRDIYITQQRPCEVLAAGNIAEDCASSVDQYEDGETLEDPVLWLQVGFHHIPRDEDEPLMNEHWQGFSMTPRNLTEKNRIIPSHHQDEVAHGH